MRGYQESKKRDTERKRLYRERQRAMETSEEAVERRARQAEQIRQSRLNRLIKMSSQEQEAHRISEVARVKRLRQSQKVNKTENEIAARRKRSTLQIGEDTVNQQPLEASEWLKREVERVRQSHFPSQFIPTLQYQEVMRLPVAQQTKKSLDTPNYVKRNRLSKRDYELLQMHDMSPEAGSSHYREQIKKIRLIKKTNHPKDTQNKATRFKRNRLSEHAYELIRKQESSLEPEPVRQFGQSPYELTQEEETHQVPKSRIDQNAIQTSHAKETKNDSESEIDETLSYQSAISLLMRRSPKFRQLMIIRLVQKQLSPKIF